MTSSSKKKYECHYCGKVGHFIKRYCRLFLSDEKKSPHQVTVNDNASESEVKVMP